MSQPMADTWRKSPPFGTMLELRGVIPNDCDVVILCRQSSLGGLIPARLLLPGQIYTSVLEEIRTEYPDTKSFTVIPARSKDYREVGEL